MRTTIAASPPRLHWQAAFTTKTYKPQTTSLVVWQHVFVSDTPMTNWGGSSLLLTRVVKKTPSRAKCCQGQTCSTTNHRGAKADRAIDSMRPLRMKHCWQPSCEIPRTLQRCSCRRPPQGRKLVGPLNGTDGTKLDECRRRT